MRAKTSTHTSKVRLPQTNGGALSDQVYEYLVERLIRGSIEYGDALNIKQLAAHLGVSPMPIRDAIKRLEMEGVVVVKPRSVCYVRKPTKRTTLAAIDAREMLEVQAISMYYRTVDRDELSGLHQLLVRMRPHAECAEKGALEQAAEIAKYIELDREFHEELCRLSRNMYIQRFYREISMHLNMSFRYGTGTCHGVETTYGEHQAIYGHLCGNSRHAVSVLRRHLRQSKQNILSDPRFHTLSD